LIEKFIKDAVDKMILDSEKEDENIGSEYGIDKSKVPEELKLPFVRLKVEYSGGY
jgi:hypothetical protein